MSGVHHHGRDGRAGSGHIHGVSRTRQRRALWLVLAANGLFFLVEVAGGMAFRSLALLADAAHMVSDVAALSIALVAQRLLDRPATARHSFGLQRAEVLGAQANGVTLVAVAGWIVYEAVRRIGDPADVVGGGLLAVAVAGLAVNLGSALLLGRTRGQSLNIRGAYLHMAVDAAGSVAAIATAVAVLVWQADWMDPVMSIVIALLAVWSACGLLRDAANVLLEGTPRGMDPHRVEATLVADDAVEAVHHLHLWNLASDVPALSAHVLLRGDVSLHDAQATGDRLKALLDQHFGIGHVTLELECHNCGPVETSAGRPDGRGSCR